MPQDGAKAQSHCFVWNVGSLGCLSLRGTNSLSDAIRRWIYWAPVQLATTTIHPSIAVLVSIGVQPMQYLGMDGMSQRSSMHVADAVYSPLVSCSCQAKILHKRRRKRFQIGLLA